MRRISSSLTVHKHYYILKRFDDGSDIRFHGTILMPMNANLMRRRVPSDVSNVDSADVFCIEISSMR